MTPQLLTLTLMLLGPSLGLAAANTTYYLDGKSVSQVEATRALINDPEAQVTKCQVQELSPQVRLRNKRRVADSVGN